MNTQEQMALKVLKVIGFVILGVAAVFGFIYVTMLLWNWLVPDLFNGPAITYWQAAGLLVLSKILFSGIGCGGSGSKSKNKDCCKNSDGKEKKWWEKFEDKCNEKEEEKANKQDQKEDTNE